MPAAPFLTVEKADDEVVVTLAGPRLGQENARLVGGSLFRLAEEAVRPRLLLDCRNVLSVTAAGLGTLVGLHKGVRSLGGQLSLCNLAPHLAEVFAVTHLTRVLDIRRASAEGAGVVGKDGAGHEGLESVSGRGGYPVAGAAAGQGDATGLRDAGPPLSVRLGRMTGSACGWLAGQPALGSDFRQGIPGR